MNYKPDKIVITLNCNTMTLIEFEQLIDSLRIHGIKVNHQSDNGPKQMKVDYYLNPVEE